MGQKRTLEEEEIVEDASMLEKIADQVLDPNHSTPKPTKKKQRVEERRSIFVRSLPSDVTNESLTEFFSEYFPVKHATVVLDGKTKQSKGYGFVTFADAEDASQAKTSLDKKLWEGKHIRIDIAEPRARHGDKEKGPAPAGKPPTREERALQSTKLIVRNLPWSIKTSEQLSQLFRMYGKVKFADLPQTKGKLKGFGFVTLRGHKNAQKALEEANGKEVDGRSIAVDWAVDKKTWADQSKNDAPEENAEAEDTSSEEEEEDDDDDDEQSKPKDAALNADLENFLKNHMRNMEDEDEDEDDEEDAEKEDEEDDKKSTQKSTDNSATIFIRNLPFTTTDEQLKEFFSQHGTIRYARVVMDKTTDKPAGTGFVCFVDEADAKTCVKNAPRSQGSVNHNKAKQSILQDESLDPEGKYTLESRLLQVAQAVSKEKAASLADNSSAERRKNDKRRLFLLNEGHIGSNSPLFNLLSESERRMRQTSTQQRRKLVEKNPTLHLSLTRLALRNIPRNLASKDLKELARKAVVGFAKDIKEGRRQPLSKEENARDSKEAKEQEHQRKLKGKGIVRQAKIVFESSQGSKVPENSGAGKSRGYGFIEYTSHHWALMGLRYLNGMQLEGDNGRKQRLVVEFAIENVQVVQRRRATENNSSQQDKPAAPAKPAKGSNPSTNANTETEGEKVAETLKKNKAARRKGRSKPSKVREDPGENAEEGSAGKADLKQTLIARKRQMRKKKAQSRGKS